MSSKRSLSRRVFVTIFSVALCVIFVFTIAGTVFMQRRMADAARQELSHEADVVAASLDSVPSYMTLLRHLDMGMTRITLVDSKGDVKYDSLEDPDDMGNHAGRPEIEQAMSGGRGSSERSSSTLGEVMLYEAVRLSDGSIIRLSQLQAGYLTVFGSFVVPLLALALAAAIVSLFAAQRESKHIIAPLREVDLDHPKHNLENAYTEMVPMLERIETQRQELKRQMKILADNDRMRRDYTANITHELKTPLTAISGYSELIANGMVASETDQREFGKKIYEETGRLTSLVNDILTLSSLDEAEREEKGGSTGVLGSREPIDLPRALDAILQRLQTVAQKSSVTIGVEASPAIVEGVPRLVDELAYNLASNAIRYNRPGGSVTLSCGLDEQGAPFIRVSDTGIGIAPEEQTKIFERFYRVDKSRSRVRGGTGLGLAIVKHAALFHNAKIDLQSELGQGTAVTVTFPVESAVKL